MTQILGSQIFRVVLEELEEILGTTSFASKISPLRNLLFMKKIDMSCGHLSAVLQVRRSTQDLYFFTWLTYTHLWLRLPRSRLEPAAKVSWRDVFSSQESVHLMVIQSGQPIDMVYPNYLQVFYHLFHSFRTFCTINIHQLSLPWNRHVSSQHLPERSKPNGQTSNTLNLQVMAWWFIAKNLQQHSGNTRSTRK